MIFVFGRKKQQSFLTRWQGAIGLSRLPPSARLVLHELSMFMNESGGSCFPTILMLTERTALNRATVQRTLSNLSCSGDEEQQPHHWVKRKLIGAPGSKQRHYTYQAIQPDIDHGDGDEPVRWLKHNHYEVAPCDLVTDQKSSTRSHEMRNEVASCDPIFPLSLDNKKNAAASNNSREKTSDQKTNTEQKSVGQKMTPNEMIEQSRKLGEPENIREDIKQSKDEQPMRELTPVEREQIDKMRGFLSGQN